VTSILTAIGLLLLFVALGGVALGIFMAVDAKTRDSGRLFSIWWVPGVAAASGVLMRDVVTFAVGTVCFLVAGAMIIFEDSRPRKAQVRGNGDLASGPEGNTGLDSEKTTKENRIQDPRKAAS